MSKVYQVCKGIIKKIVPTPVRKGIRCIANEGMDMFMYKVRRYLGRANQYKMWIDTVETSEKKHENLTYNPMISVIMTIQNAEPSMVIESVRSVVTQTYGNWQLCLVTGESLDAEVDLMIRKKGAKGRIKLEQCDKDENHSKVINAGIAMADGEFVGFLGCGDILAKNALHDIAELLNKDNNYDFIYSDEDKITEDGKTRKDPLFKPDWSPDTIVSTLYTGQFSVFRKEILSGIDGMRSELGFYDMVLRFTDRTDRIGHVSRILYHVREHENRETIDADADRIALEEHLNRIGLKGEIENTDVEGVYQIKYMIQGTPKISIMIPNKDHVDDLKKCIESINSKSTYKNYEIIIIENNSESEETFNYYESLSGDDRIRIIYWEGEFNYSAINNFGAKDVRGDYILLLNNDIEVITPDWLEQMLMFAQRKDVGAVGAMLYYPDDTIQHAGVILGIGKVAGHSHKYLQRNTSGYQSRLKYAQNLSAVTAACMMIRKEVFEEVHGLDETFRVAFNDVDLCMRIRAAGYHIVFTPFAELYHYESKSRGVEDTPEKIARFNGESDRFLARWGKTLEAGDPYYNMNLTLKREDFSLRLKDEWLEMKNPR